MPVVMAWLGAITAAFQFGSLMLKTIREQNKNIKTANEEMKGLRDAMKQGRENGDLSEVEERIKGFGINKPSA